MASLRVSTYNVRGLCSPHKRSTLWGELKRLKTQVVFLQETHFTPKSLPKLPTHLFNQWFISTSPTPKSKGTAIAIHKACPFQPAEHDTDPLGRYVFLKGNIAGQKYTFATIYAPNADQLTFIDTTLDRLAEFREGFLILGGDFNVSPDPMLDTSHARPSHSYAFLKHFRRTIQSHLLTDSWRALRPLDRDFSYYSTVHNVYTRIDHIYVDRNILELLQSADIGSISISDHAPVTMAFSLPSGTRGVRTWRLNENLLDDAVVMAEVADTLAHYFAENPVGELSEGTVWEAHKAVVRGALISQGSRLKKIRQADFLRVHTELQKAELRHKANGRPEDLEKLTELRELFLRLLDRQTRKQFRFMAHRYYEHGNKCGRMLARALRKRQAQTYIHKLHSASGTPILHPSKIAAEF